MPRPPKKPAFKPVSLEDVETLVTSQVAPELLPPTSNNVALATELPTDTEHGSTVEIEKNENALKVFITPSAKAMGDTNGVGRVLKALERYLPEFGIQLVSSPAQAQIKTAHIFGDVLEEVDVLSLHGLIFTGDRVGEYDQSHHNINRRIVNGLRKARYITIPSEWAAMPFKRDMRLSPVVIPNGVDLEEWQSPVSAFDSVPVENKGYILWNKNREDNVCNPLPAYELALLGEEVVTTFPPIGKPVTPTLRVIGKKPYAEMQQIIKNADIYLATTQEIASLGVLEALAAGIPVLGYNWGNTAEVVRHKVEGYLVEPGDITGLVDGLKWLRENRNEVSQSAKERAKDYDWRPIVERYAILYKSVYAEKLAETHKVAIVITNHNYAEYLPSALTSCEAQVRKADRVIVVDDASTDNSLELLKKYPEIEVIQLPENKGVAHARNVGIKAATDCQYIICLDADDMLHTAYIETLLPHLVKDRALGVVWSKVQGVDKSGTPIANALWDFDFKWETQAHPTPDGRTKNGIPCAAMFRREMWERAGGYKQVYHPAEDAEFWLRGLSLGFTAERVTNEPLMLYRHHADSASRTKPQRSIHTWHNFATDKQYPFASPSEIQPVIRSYSSPDISVIIPVGQGHEELVARAIDSVLGQSFRNWELIVVDDAPTEDPYSCLFSKLGGKKTYPFIKRVYGDAREGSIGQSAARNKGLFEAKAPLVVFLDADDWLMPTALEKMFEAYQKAEYESCYIYTDWHNFNGTKLIILSTTNLVNKETYSQKRILEKLIHPVTVLMRKEDALAVGGFDTALQGFEDWDFFCKLAIKGVCGIEVNEKLLSYQTEAGTQRKKSYANKDAVVAAITERYKEYQEGGKNVMACGSCGGGRKSVEPKQGQGQGQDNTPKEGEVLIRYTGNNPTPIPMLGNVTNKVYYFGANRFEQQVLVDARDAEFFLTKNFLVRA